MTVRPQAAPRRGRPGYDRAAVQRVAVALFNERGYEATSVSDLAARLGLTKSALYHHFDSKEQVLGAALDDALSALEAVLHERPAQSGPVAERLAYVLRRAVEVLVQKLPEVTLLLRVRGNLEVERAALQRRRAFDQHVTALVRAAQAEGSVRADVDASAATRLIFGMVNSIVEWYRPTGADAAAGLAQDVLRVALDGLRTR